MSGQGAGWDGEYAELGAVTNFSFLEGASHPAELMHQAKSLGRPPSGWPTAIRWQGWCGP